MNILITGGRGFIGNHLADRLKKDNEVEVYDLPDDILDYPKLEERIKDKDLVWHFAAIADLNWASKNIETTFKVNVQGTVNVATLCSKFGVKLNYISTGCVYGYQTTFPTDEKAIPDPNEIYAYSKLMGEQAVIGISKQFGLDYNIARLSTVYGPGMRKALAVFIFFDQALKNLPITIHGKGEQTRSLIYIDDLIEGLVKLNGSYLNNEIYNFAGKESVSALDMAKAIKQLTKSKSPITHIDQRPNQTMKEVISYDKAERLLDWYPKIDFIKGLERTQSYLTNNTLKGV